MSGRPAAAAHWGGNAIAQYDDVDGETTGPPAARRGRPTATATASARKSHASSVMGTRSASRGPTAGTPGQLQPRQAAVERRRPVRFPGRQDARQLRPRLVVCTESPAGLLLGRVRCHGELQGLGAAALGHLRPVRHGQDRAEGHLRDVLRPGRRHLEPRRQPRRDRRARMRPGTMPTATRSSRSTSSISRRSPSRRATSISARACRNRSSATTSSMRMPGTAERANISRQSAMS